MNIRYKLASSLGSIIEWYDFALYSFFAGVITKLYFPSANGLLQTFSIFAVSFLARPIGALLFGYVGDKYGRAVSLKITPLLITVPTFILAILPTYQIIGVFAPIILIALRVWQGLCIGGEYSNNIIYLCESALPHRVYFSGSIGSCSGSLGILLASAITTLCYHQFSPENLQIWGWRVAFSLSLLMGIVTYIVRKKMPETPAFKKVSEAEVTNVNPISLSYKHDIKNYFLAFGITFLPATAFYFVFMFLPNFSNTVLKINLSDIMGDNVFSLSLRLLIIPLLGLLADKIGGIRLARIACFLYLILGYPLFFGLVHYRSTFNLFILSFAILTTFNAATTPGLLMNLLKPNTRCTVFSFSFNCSFGIFGGLAPIISFLLIKKFNNSMASVYYLMFAALLTFVTTFFLKLRNDNEK